MKEFVLEDYRLRKIDIKDSNDIFDIQADESVTRFLPIESYTDINKTKEYILYLINSCEINKIYCWVIENIKTNKVIGYIEYEIDSKNNKAEIGFVLSKDYWNKGITSMLLKVIIDYGFNELKFNKIEAQCELENIGSIRVLEKNNFELEGILKKDRYRKGRYVDRRYYGLLSSEYNN